MVLSIFDVRKSLRIPGAVALVFVILAIVVVVVMPPKTQREIAHGVDYSWNGVSVGTVTTLSTVPEVRHAEIICYPTDDPSKRIVLWKGPQSELPGRAAFVSGDGPKVTYKLPGGQELVIDLSAAPNAAETSN